MLKLALFAFLIGAVFVPSAFAFVDMTQVIQRANDLKMTTSDYAFAMSIAGTLSGFLFGLSLMRL